MTDKTVTFTIINDPPIKHLDWDRISGAAYRRILEDNPFRPDRPVECELHDGPADGRRVTLSMRVSIMRIPASNWRAADISFPVHSYEFEHVTQHDDVHHYYWVGPPDELVEQYEERP